jgi:hypothetical protein
VRALLALLRLFRAQIKTVITAAATAAHAVAAALALAAMHVTATAHKAGRPFRRSNKACMVYQAIAWLRVAS